MFGLFLFLVIAYVAYAAYSIRHSASLSVPLIKAAHPYNREDPALVHTLLVIGDSTAVGVGSPAESTVAARLADYTHASVENYAVSGAVTADLEAQMSHARREKYDLILLQIGANDVIGFRSLDTAASQLDTALQKLRRKSDHVMVLTAGNIGTAPIFPRPVGWVMSYRTRALRERFIAECTTRGAIYVDIYIRPDPFLGNEERYYAPDGLHLSAEGYAYWFSVVKEYVDSQWPQLAR